MDLDPLLDAVGDRRLVLLGEASHGTSEYYRWRAAITERLVAEKGFSFVAVEGDWPDCRRVDRFLKNGEGSAEEAVRLFARWPTWMWANRETLDLVAWLRGWNEGHPGREVGFFGLDVYSLWDSIEVVVRTLERLDPAAARRARDLYRCFDPHARDEQAYARSTVFVPAGCQREVLAALREVRAARLGASEDAFEAEQNALVAANAEAYYRAMVRGDAESWNLRDRHMTDTLARLAGRHGKGVVWAHNTHVGDARFTDMAPAGMVNLGQLARERWGEDDVLIVGLSGHRGEVIAARAWGDPARRMPVPPAVEGSWEDRLHRTLGEDALLLRLDEGTRGLRAIGVVYHPEREAWGNYVSTELSGRFDALLHFEETRAVRPLYVDEAALAEPPETFPFGE